MNWIILYDQWIFHRLEVLLLWLEEWFSISQKRAEQSMIVLYLLLNIPSLYIPSPILSFILIPFKIICVGSVGCVMWILHQRPDFVRKSAREGQFDAVLRIVVQILFGTIAGFTLFLVPHRWADLSQALAQLLYAVFFYVTNITSNGKPGRRRKMALADLKKMFGFEWIPKPIPVPQ
jgi:hypothetical protein